jgi:hypothetical protein
MGKRIGTWTGWAFVTNVCVVVVTGILCVLTAPKARTEVAGSRIPSNAVCHRTVRAADYVAVELAVGVPPRRQNLLLRFNLSATQTRLFSERLVESLTFECNGSKCSDVFLATHGDPNSNLRRFVFDFEYSNSYVEQRTFGVAVYRLNLDGEFFLFPGTDYWLTATHLCYADSRGEGPTEVVADVTGDGLVVLTSSVASSAELVSTAVSRAVKSGDCKSELNSTVAFLPLISSSEASYLSIRDPKWYSTAPHGVEQRRRTVELGAMCASAVSDLTHAYSIYRLDCDSKWDECRDGPSVPFRRVSKLNMWMRATDTKVAFAFARDETLFSLPSLMSVGSATNAAVVKLLVVVLAAAVIWIRSSSVTSSSLWLVKHYFLILKSEPLQTRDKKAAGVIEDLVLGLLAILTRVSVVVWRMTSLDDDDEWRVCWWQLIAVVASFVSLVLRFFVITPSLSAIIKGAILDGRDPIARLGGSMALMDCTSSMILVFSQPPVLFVAKPGFDATARMLSGLLASLVTVYRALWSCTCVVLMLDGERSGMLAFDSGYRLVLWIAVGLWVVQLLTLSVTLADLVVTPMASTLTRGVEGEKSAVPVALFLAFLCAGLPRMGQTAVRLLEKDQKDD